MGIYSYMKLGSNKIFRENNSFDWFMNVIYSKGDNSVFIKLLAKKYVSDFIGLIMKSYFSKYYVSKFIKKYGVVIDDFEIANWKSFNDFFIRKVKLTSRPFSKSCIISPCDGKIIIRKLNKNSNFSIKGENLNLNKFLADSLLSDKFSDGTLIIIRLSPTDYHRFHYPFTGDLLSSNKISGSLFSVQPIALKSISNIFVRNKREISVLKSGKHEVIYSEVGATGIGSIVNTRKLDIFKIGDEKGYFQFGGSTIVLIFKNGEFKPSTEIYSNSCAGYETEILMGNKIGNFK